MSRVSNPVPPPPLLPPLPNEPKPPPLPPPVPGKRWPIAAVAFSATRTIIKYLAYLGMEKKYQGNKDLLLTTANLKLGRGYLPIFNWKREGSGLKDEGSRISNLSSPKTTCLICAMLQNQSLCPRRGTARFSSRWSRHRRKGQTH